MCHDESAVLFSSTTHMNTTIQNTGYLPPVQKVHILACSWHVSMTHALHCVHKCGYSCVHEIEKTLPWEKNSTIQLLRFSR